MKKITKLQLDVLKEIGNIGAGKACSALSVLIGRKVNVKIAKVKTISINDVSTMFGKPGAPAVCIIFHVSGESPGYLMLMSSEKAALSLLSILENSQNEKHEKHKNLKNIDQMCQDTLKEIGNILIGNYLAALSDFSGENLIESTPQLVIGKTKEIIQEIISLYDHSVKYVIALNNQMIVDKGKYDEELVMIFKPGSFETLFKSIGKKTGCM